MPLDLNPNCPIGLEWDNQNWSCAYDNLFVILYDIWKENPDEWTNNFKNINRHMQALAYKFQEVYEKKKFLWKILEMILEKIYTILILINFLWVEIVLVWLSLELHY